MCGKRSDIEVDHVNWDIVRLRKTVWLKGCSLSLFKKNLTVQRVYETFDKMKKVCSGTVETKMGMIVGLLADASPKEAKYILRTLTGKLRLGIADMTVYALSIAYGGGKEAVRKLNVPIISAQI